MQLRRARLCLDCEEVHDLDQCPRCASEALAYLTQWLPADEQGRLDHAARWHQSSEGDDWASKLDRWDAGASARNLGTALLDTAPGWALRLGTSVAAALATISPFD